MENEVEKFAAAISWLAQGGRSHAKLLATLDNDNEQFRADLEEAIGWLTDIADGYEI